MLQRAKENGFEIQAYYDDDGEAWFNAEHLCQILDCDLDDVIINDDTSVDYDDGKVYFNYSGAWEACIQNKANDCEELLEALRDFEDSYEVSL
jgi:prophage antirepressor-like protein